MMLRLAASVIIVAALILSMSSLVSAVGFASYSADYDVHRDDVFVKVTIVLPQEASQFEWSLPGDATNIAVDKLRLNVLDLKVAKLLQVEGAAFGTVSFSYSTASVLEKTKDSFFILDLAGIDAGKKSVAVRLPEKATLKYSLDASHISVIPKAGSVTTDGRRIIIGWNESSLEGGTALLVIYSEPRQLNAEVLAAATGVLLLAGVAVSFYRRRKAGAVASGIGAEKAKLAESSGLTRNLFEDERKVVEILIGAGDDGLWQKQLGIMTGVSKVKLSRKLRSLEQKGLIEKIPYGNANKIRLKKA